MLPPMIRQRIQTLLPLLHQAGPAGETIANRLAIMLDAPDSGPGAISAEEWRLAADELLRRLPDLQRDIRASVGTLSQLLVSMTLPADTQASHNNGLRKLASQVGGAVAGWVVDPSNSAIAQKVAGAVLPGLEKLTPWVRQFASPSAGTAAPMSRDFSTPDTGARGPDNEPVPQQVPGDEIEDPWETGTLGRTGGA